MKQISLYVFLLTIFVGHNYQIQASGILKFFVSLSDDEKRWLDAANQVNLEVMQQLAASGKININVQDESGHSALIMAANRGHKNIVEFLLSLPEINVNIRDKNGNTALIFAVPYFNQNHENIVKLLLQRPEIDINAQAKRGGTALMNSAAHEPSRSLLQLLELPNLNIDLQNNKGQTAFILAAARGNQLITERLLNTAHLENLINKDLYTAILWAKIMLMKLNHYYKISGPSYDYKYSEIDSFMFHYSGKEKAYSKIILMLESKMRQLCINAIKNHDFKAFRNIFEQFENISDKRRDSLEKELRKTVDFFGHELWKIIVSQVSGSIINLEDGAKLLLAQIRSDDCNKLIESLIEEAFNARCSEIVIYLLQKAKDPRELLALLPFEKLNPTTDLFKYIFNLGYPETAPMSKSNIFADLYDLLFGQFFTQATEESEDESLKPKCHRCLKEAVMQCSKCKSVYYCDTECQKADWPEHKHNCKPV